MDGTYTADEVVAALAPVLTEERRYKIAQVVRQRLQGLTVVLENLHDPHNGAAVLRSMEALGIVDLYVVEKREQFSFSSKIAQGCEKWLEIHHFPDFALAVQTLRHRGFRLYGAVPDGQLTLEELDVATPAALVFGNEHAGLSDEAKRACDVTFRIPMWGFTRSLNLSVSVALSIYSYSQKRRQDLRHTGDLTDAEMRELCSRYYQLSVDARARDQLVHRAREDGTIIPTLCRVLP